LIAGGGKEKVVIADEGASSYDDAWLLKIGKNGALIKIPQRKVMNIREAFGAVIPNDSSFAVRSDIDRPNQSWLFRKRPNNLASIRVNYRDSLIDATDDQRFAACRKSDRCRFQQRSLQ
jgi:hypothetical protein